MSCVVCFYELDSQCSQSVNVASLRQLRQAFTQHEF